MLSGSQGPRLRTLLWGASLWQPPRWGEGARPLVSCSGAAFDLDHRQSGI